MPTHYEVLGVPEGASDGEVRQAYRRLVKTAHPDVAGDATRFRLVTDAYDVLSDPARRAAYDRSLRAPAAPAPHATPVPGRRPRRYGPYIAVALAALGVAAVVLLVVATTWERSVGDDCLVGSWRGEEFEVPFQAVSRGEEITARIRGGTGVRLTVAADGAVRTDYGIAAPLTGADRFHRVEGVYRGTTTERWRAARGRVKQTETDAQGLTFAATVDGRPPDQPVAVTVLDEEYAYRCTATALELGPYRYTRASG